MKPVTRYESADGDVFLTKEEAVKHEKDLENISQGNPIHRLVRLLHEIDPDATVAEELSQGGALWEIGSLGRFAIPSLLSEEGCFGEYQTSFDEVEDVLSYLGDLSEVANEDFEWDDDAGMGTLERILELPGRILDLDSSTDFFTDVCQVTPTISISFKQYNEE
jgi:hypothetical protein